MRIYDLARLVRSKNAGPFSVTVDIFASTDEDFDLIVPALVASDIADAYSVNAIDVRIITLKSIGVIKVTVPRRVSSGAPGDTDVYGCQQHMQIGSIKLDSGSC
jgi:hypothetical protein